MDNALWQFANTVAPTQLSPVQVLEPYAARLGEDTGSLILGKIVERFQEVRDDAGMANGQLAYVLYLVVPRLRNYSYRLIELKQPDLAADYPVDIQFFLKDNIIEAKAADAQQLETQLRKFVRLGSTINLLTAIRSQVETLEKYSTDADQKT